MATYEIIIKNKSSGGARSSVAGSTSSSAKDKQQDTIAGVAVYGYAKKLATQVVSHRVNTVELRTGQAELQQKISFKYDVAKQAFGFFESIAIGGGLAGISGAVIGGVLSLGSMLVNLANRQDTININRDIENVSISQNNIRAGAGQSRREN